MRVIPSLNITQRMHWTQLKRLRDSYVPYFMVAKAQAGFQKPEKWERRRVKILVVRYSSRQLDNDNFVGGCKQLIDAIRDAELIRDDSPKWVDVEYQQVKCGRLDARTEVHLYWAEG
jgi:hypothetical protein